MSGKQLWVSYGRTESGDDLTPLIWDRKPAYAEVGEVYKELYPEEYSDCGGVSHRTEEGQYQGN